MKTGKNQKFAEDKRATANNFRASRSKKNKKGARRGFNSGSKFAETAKANTSDVTEGNAYAKMSRINDINWYVNNQQMLNDVCRIPYNIPVGQPLYNKGNLPGIAANEYNMAIPGIICMDLIPTYGFAHNPSDPINAAFAAMFTYIRSHTSSKFDWDDNTLGINLLATDSVYYYTTWLQRLFATLPLWHQSNKYLAQALIEAQGVDYDDLKANANWFRTQINLYTDRINALAMPAGIYVFDRHKWLFQNYYIEGESTKDQIYMYRPAAIYIHERDTNGISKLGCHRVLAGGSGTDGRLTAADLIRKLDSMLDPIFNDQYFNLIGGYLREAYNGNMMQIPLLPDQAVMPLIYSEEVLLQFKNAKCYPIRHSDNGAKYYGDTFDLEQRPASATDIRVCLKTLVNGLAFRLYRQINDDVAVDIDATSSDAEKYAMYYVGNEATKDNLITTPHANVEASENMINTRLIPSLVWSENEASGMPNLAFNEAICGTEWPVAFDVFCRCYDNWTNSWDMVRLRLHTTMYFDPFATDGTPFKVTTRYLPLISKFKYIPELKLVTRSVALDPSDPTTNASVAPAEQSFFEVDNYALLNVRDLAAIHTSAELSMLRFPEIATQPV